MSNKNLTVGVVVAIVIAITGLFFPLQVKQAVDSTLGAFGSRFPNGLAVGVGTNITTDGAMVVGNGGSNLTFVKAGTCTILANASIAASTTASVDCVAPGVQSGDIITANLNASTTLSSNFLIRGITASSTSGFITFSLLNQTGAAVVPAATNGVGSSTSYEDFRAL